MTRQEFEKKVKKEIANFTEEQKKQFAWRSAVRALPFLGVEGHFNLSPQKDRQQKHLYDIFRALDMAADSAEIITILNALINNPALATLATLTPNNLVTAFYVTIILSVSVEVAEVKNINLKSIILADIAAIKSNQKPQIDIKIYGEIWDNFQTALAKEGCAYWGKLYADIFANNFALDKTALEMRLNAPFEKREQGAAAVGDFLEILEREGAKKLNEARIIILGEKGAGKTCVARRLIDPDAPMTTPAESTPGVDTSIWQPPDEDLNIRIWDFAGHRVTQAVHQFFFSKHCTYILVYDSRTDNTDKLHYWLNQVKNYGGNSQVIILVNEKGDPHRAEIPINTLKKKYSIIELYFLNVKEDRDKLLDFRQKIIHFIKKNAAWKVQKIPTSYYQVKEALEARFAQLEKGEAEEYISKQAFLEVAKTYKVEKSETLLKDLHDLGISLWYKDMDKYDTLVLNPEWISDAVYRIINWVNAKKDYKLTLTCFGKVFETQRQRFPQDKDRFLFDLIKHYELAYEREDTLVIPHLLKEDQPSQLPIFDVDKSLMLKYVADSPLLPDTISRFIVRRNEQIYKNADGEEQVWRRGVILEDGKGSLALVKEEDRTISISVKGEQQTTFLTQLRKSLNDIFENYKSKKPELKYRVKKALFLEETSLRGLNDNRIRYEPSIEGQEVNITEVVKNYNIGGNLVVNPSPIRDKEAERLDSEKQARQDSYREEQLKKWQKKRTLLFGLSLLLFFGGVFYFVYEAGGDLILAKEMFMSLQDNIIGSIVVTIGGVMSAYTCKMLYDCRSNHTEMSNYKKEVKLPDYLK